MATSKTDQPFAWCRMTHQSSECLQAILARKEAERLAGGVFWWGMGKKLSIAEAACKSGTLSVQFSAKYTNSESGPHYLWTHWLDSDGHVHEIPSHVLVVGPVRKSKEKLALICRSDQAIALHNQPFDTRLFQNYPSGEPLVDLQPAAILTRRIGIGVDEGTVYQDGFRANLISPWQVELVRSSRTLTEDEWNRLDQWQPGDDWLSLVRSIRGQSGSS